MKVKIVNDKFYILNVHDVEVGYLEFHDKFISDIYIHMGFRNNGYGLELLKQFINYFDYKPDEIEAIDVIILKLINKIK